MNKTSIFLVIIIILVGGYFFLSGDKQKQSKMPKNPSAGFVTLNNSMNEYEKLIKTYEDKGGLKTPQDMLQFSAEIQTKIPTYNASELTQEEAKIIGDRLNSLRERQMKLINYSR